MPLYKFNQSDIFHNRIETHPQCNFFIYSGSVYYNNRPQLSGAITSSVPCVPPGHINLYELNVDRDQSAHTYNAQYEDDTLTETGIKTLIYPFIIKDSTYTDFRKRKYSLDAEGNRVLAITNANYGDPITGSYPMSASIAKDHFSVNHVSYTSTTIYNATVTDPPTIQPSFDEFGYQVKTTLGSKIAALRNRLDSYIYLSHHYAYSSASFPDSTSTIAQWNKAEQEIGLISIPSIFYDTAIEKGTVNLKFYITGTMVGELRDENKNGELIQVGPMGSRGSGSVAGVALYNEGFLLLTGSWDLTSKPRATAELKFNRAISDGDTVTLTDTAGNTVVLKYSHANTHADGRLHADGTSVNVGISDATGATSGDIALQAGRFQLAVNRVTSYSNSLTLNIEADPSFQGSAADTAVQTMTLTQEEGGNLGNTDISIYSRNASISGPSSMKFSGGEGIFSPHTEDYVATGASTSATTTITFFQAGTISNLGGESITLSDPDGNTVVFKFTTANTAVDGRLHSDGTSVNVGVSGYTDADDAGTAFISAINNVTSYFNGLFLNITAEEGTTFSASQADIDLTLTRPGHAGNTTIGTTFDPLDEDKILISIQARFTGGKGGAPRWIDFAQTIATGSVYMPSSSFELDFKGTNHVPVMTLLAHARKGHLNFSNNPTYIKHGQSMVPTTSSIKFREPTELEIKNIISSSYQDFTASYRRQTYISKIGIYDKYRNLIGIAKVATPVKKTEERDFTFKLKLDF